MSLIENEIKKLENEIKADNFLTKIKKESFINEIKSGLGDKIKNNPKSVKVIKEPFLYKLKKFLKNIFTKF